MAEAVGDGNGQGGIMSKNCHVWICFGIKGAGFVRFGGDYTCLGVSEFGQGLLLF